MSKKKRDRCLFCGTYGEMTDEDVVSLWIARELKQLYHPDTDVMSVSVEAHGSAILHQHVVRAGNAGTMKLPQLCEPCNKEMGALEKRASLILRPTIGGTPVSISPADQLTLGTWGTLKALTYDAYPTSEPKVSGRPDLRAFYASPRPAPDFSMWLGRFNGVPGHLVDFAFHVRDTTFSPFPYPGLPAGTPHAQLMTLRFGRLVLQSVFVGVRGRVSPSSYDRPPNEAFTIKVWPPSPHTQEWPPSIGMDIPAFAAFANVPEAVIRRTLPPEPDAGTTAP